MTVEEYKKLVAEGLVIIEFGTSLCCACGGIRLKIEQWKSKRIRPVIYQYISMDENKALAAQEGIFAGPAVLVYIDGKIFIRKIGYFSLEKILQDIDRYEGIKKEEP